MPFRGRGEIFERVLVERIRKGLETKGPDLAEEQFGFRRGRSTNNALEEVKKIIDEIIERKGVACMISVDVTNAFNTISWECIELGLKEYGICKGIRKVITGYFENRFIEYWNKDGDKKTRKLEVGVPQGSVVGPTLWNVAYDRVLRTAIPTGGRIICYADDTLILVGGKNRGEAIGRANLALECIVRKIKELGLKVAPEKSEAMIFYKENRAKTQGKENKEEDEEGIEMERTKIKIGRTIKYLGLYIDENWDFESHFEIIGRKMEGATDGQVIAQHRGTRRRRKEAVRGNSTRDRALWCTNMVEGMYKEQKDQKDTARNTKEVGYPRDRPKSLNKTIHICLNKVTL